MVSALRTISLAAALVAAALLLTTPQTRAWATAEAEAEDMVPVPPAPAEGVMVAIPGGGGVGTLAAPVCLQCRCCSKSDPSKCEVTSCCSTFNCDPAGKCNVVQQQCGCSGC